MPQHKLGPGRLLISALLELGEALGYAVEPEHRLPNGTAAVDVAWLRRAGDTAPLVVFEIESRAGEGLANNAMKVLGRASARAMKPLHLFHVVVLGGIRSERPVDVAREFAGHNYSVHLLSASEEPRRLLESVLDVHRRVSDRLDGVALARAIVRPPWPRELLEPLLQHAEALGFAGLSEPSYVQLARESPAFEASLLRKLTMLWRQKLAGAVDPPDRYLGQSEQLRYEDYGSYMAAAAYEPLELGLLAALKPAEGPRALATLQRWQEVNHIGDRPGPFSGAGVQWTVYAAGHLGFMWALVAALMCNVRGARAWCAAQPAALLEALYGNDWPHVPLLAVWVMHLCAGISGREAMYDRARTRLELAGGVSKHWLAAPEPAAPPEDAEESEWDRIFGEPDQRLAPRCADLLALVREHGRKPGNPVVLALDAFLEEPAYRPSDGGAVVALLARDAEAESTAQRRRSRG
jgi:hypothetical protein